MKRRLSSILVSILIFSLLYMEAASASDFEYIPEPLALIDEE